MVTKMACKVEIVFECDLFKLALAKYEKPIIINGVERLYTLREMEPVGRPPYLSLTIRNMEKNRLLNYKFFNYSKRDHWLDGRAIMSIDKQLARGIGRYTEFVFHKSMVCVKSIHSIIPTTSPYGDEVWKTMTEQQYVRNRILDCNVVFDIDECIDSEIQKMLPELIKHREELVSKINTILRIPGE